MNLVNLHWFLFGVFVGMNVVIFGFMK